MISRADFAHYLHTGSAPIYFKDAMASSHFPDANARLGVDLDEVDLPPTSVPDPILSLGEQDIAIVFQQLHTFSRDLNLLKANKQKISQNAFQNKLCLLQSRLLGLQGKMQSILAECLRLAMLAYLTTTFQIPWNAVRYPFLAKNFRTCYSALGSPESQSQGIRLWFLTIGAISLYGLHDPWLRERWQADIPRPRQWREAEQILRQFPWVDAIHGRLAESAFNVLQFGVDLGPEDTEVLCASGWAICALSM